MGILVQAGPNPVTQRPLLPRTVLCLPAGWDGVFMLFRWSPFLSTLKRRPSHFPRRPPAPTLYSVEPPGIPTQRVQDKEPGKILAAPKVLATYKKASIQVNCSDTPNRSAVGRTVKDTGSGIKMPSW